MHVSVCTGMHAYAYVHVRTHMYSSTNKGINLVNWATITLNNVKSMAKFKITDQISFGHLRLFRSHNVRFTCNPNHILLLSAHSPRVISQADWLRIQTWWGRSREFLFVRWLEQTSVFWHHINTAKICNGIQFLDWQFPNKYSCRRRNQATNSHILPRTGRRMEEHQIRRFCFYWLISVLSHLSRELPNRKINPVPFVHF